MYGPATGSSPARLIGRSPLIVAARKAIARLARLDTPVLITGEEGTETQLAARAIHDARRGPPRPFFECDVCPIPELSLDAEIFGYERDAFSGATSTRPGWLEQADGCTLCLRNFEFWPRRLQPKLLRVLREGTAVRVGGDRPIPVTVRLLAISSGGTEGFKESGPASAELYDAVRAERIALPPLRERGADIAVLAHHYLRQFRSAYALPTARLTPDALSALKTYAFPGNVLELANIIERTLLLCDGPSVGPGDLFPREKGMVPASVEMREITRRLARRRRTRLDERPPRPGGRGDATR